MNFVKAVALFFLVAVFTDCDRTPPVSSTMKTGPQTGPPPVSSKAAKTTSSKTVKTDSVLSGTMQTIYGQIIPLGHSGIYPAPIKLVWGALSGHGRILVEPVGKGCLFNSQNFLIGNPSGIPGNEIAPVIFYGSPPCKVKVTRGD